MGYHWEVLDLYKALLALGAGTILGLERELKDKAAGLKTMTVICLGSTLFSILSYKVGGIDHDSTRIASYIVSGIGFIGAGVIFKDGAGVSGLTTASIIWLAAAVGTAIGFSEFFLAGTFMLASLLMIYSSSYINKLFHPQRQNRILIFSIAHAEYQNKEKIIGELLDQGIRVEEKRLELTDNKLIVSLEVVVRRKSFKWLEDYLLGNRLISGFSIQNK